MRLFKKKKKINKVYIPKEVIRIKEGEEYIDGMIHTTITIRPNESITRK